MEIIFNYETAKHTLILTAYLMLIIFDCWWFGYLVISFTKWMVKKVKRLFPKKKNEEASKGTGDGTAADIYGDEK